MQKKKKIYEGVEIEVALIDPADIVTSSMSGNIDDDGIDSGNDSWDIIHGSW